MMSEQKPDAWLTTDWDDTRHVFFDEDDAKRFAWDHSGTYVPLYAAPEAALVERDTAQRELAAYKQALADLEAWPLASTIYGDYVPGWINGRVAELLAQEGVVVAMTTPNVISNEPPTAQPQYREPTLEDAWALCESLCDAGIDYSDAISSIDEVTLVALKQLGFVRKVQP